MELVEAIRKAKRVYLIGNGGSAANAIHIANDLLAVGVKAYTLDHATLTASANDFGFETVYARWLKVVGEPEDLLIALSGSGRSPNIVNAIEAAKDIGIATCGIFGAFGRHAVKCDVLITSGADMQAAERHQLTIGHRVMKCLKNS